MSKMTAHDVSLEDSDFEDAMRDAGDSGKLHLATIAPADSKVCRMVLRADPNSDDGRSQYVWVRLANGDLILGVYPQGETYEKTEVDPNRP